VVDECTSEGGSPSELRWGRCQSEFDDCILRRIVLRRIRALVLLSALLSPVGGAVTAAVFPQNASCSCCGGAMCPMHRSEKSQHRKPLCGGENSSQPQTCMCAPSQPTQAMLPPVALQAIVPVEPAGLHQPPIGDTVGMLHAAPILVRSVSPPDQPPRP